MLFVVNGTLTAMVMHKAAGLVSCVRRVLALDRRGYGGCNHISDGQQQLQCRERALSKGRFVQLPFLSHPLSRFPLMSGLQLGSICPEDCSAMQLQRCLNSLSQKISHMLLATKMISLLENPSMVDSKSMVTML